ncbi:YkgJ family cysteine cluster protein [Candidatus Woesearchaeota archaeon]|nr:YkgJ family cysteine cluster protein [Candidatus Woesearchaeota archaeon]
MLNPKTFNCERCGECCKKLYIILNDSDIKNIEKHGYQLDSFSETEQVGEYKGKRVLKKINGRCVFLTNDSLCKIYDSRPEICKKYPFFEKEVDSCLGQ